MAKKRRRSARRRGEVTGAIELEPPPRPAEAWSVVVAYFQRMSPLETETARRLIRRLMFALDREALAIFKVGRRLEDPDVTPRGYDKLRVHHGRAAIVDRLREEDFADRHVALAQLDDLYDRVGLLSRHWYAQGGMILDSVASLRVSLELYEFQLGKIRRPPGENKPRGRKRGRKPSVAWHFLIGEQVRRGLSDEEVARSLARAGYIADQEGPRRSLQESIRKRRARHLTSRR
jgi:hypothetical protein